MVKWHIQGHFISNWGWLLANNQEEREAFSPTAYKKLKATSDHRSLKADLSPRFVLVETWAPATTFIAASRDPEAEPVLLTHRNYEI